MMAYAILALVLALVVVVLLWRNALASSSRAANDAAVWKRRAEQSKRQLDVVERERVRVVSILSERDAARAEVEAVRAKLEREAATAAAAIDRAAHASTDADAAAALNAAEGLS